MNVAGTHFVVRTIGLTLAAVTLAVAGAAQEFHLAAEVELRPSTQSPGAWTVTTFNPLTITISGAAFEGDRNFRQRIVDTIKVLRLKLPLELNDLPTELAKIDPSREWRPVTQFASPATLQLVAAAKPGNQYVLLRYGKDSSFKIEVHVHGNDLPGPDSTQPLSATPVISVVSRAKSFKEMPGLNESLLKAGQQARAIAEANQFVFGGSPGDNNAINKGLAAAFLIDGIRDTAPDYVALQDAGRGTALKVQPVFIPKNVHIELTNWVAVEADQSPAIAAKLRQVRRKREEALRREIVRIQADQYTLVTNEDLKRWRESSAGRKLGLTPLRHEDETLVLGGTEALTEKTYIGSGGLSYGATDGLQGTGSLGFIYDHNSHVELKADASYGDKADAVGGSALWRLAKPWAGWSPTFDTSLAAQNNDAAYFGSATGGNPLEWEHWHGNAGLTVSRARTPVETDRREINSIFSLSANLVHSDDAFTSATPLPAEPDTSFEATVSWQFKATFSQHHRRLNLGVQARLAQSTTSLGGNYDGRLFEGQFSAAYISKPLGGRPWKAAAIIRGGDISGTLPLGSQFRAGGDDGWIRGLREGELTGNAYSAQSVSVGPEVSSLFGDKTARRPPVYLLAFYDWGRLKDQTGAWQSAEGYGVALNLDDMPLGEGVTAALYVGYAYSPNSLADPHGNFFVRIDLPFEKH